MDIPQQTFYCQCKGCPNGEGFAFEDAPENWWTRKGMKPPKNCKQCRKWIKSQVDEEVRCSECRGAIRLPARYKIRYHKRIGVYTKPLLCTSCTWNKKRGKKPLPRLTRAEYDEEKLNEKKRAEKYRKHPKTSPARSYTISTNPADYQHLVFNKHTRSLETRQEHIEHHTEWSAYSWVGHVAYDKSPTYLGIDKQTLAALLRDAAAIARETDPAKVAEQPQGNGRMVKIDLATGEKVIIDTNDGKLVTGWYVG